MPNRTCTVPGCDRPHRATGLCVTHYNQRNYPKKSRHKAIEIPCARCGTVVMKSKRTDRTSQYCSLKCRDAVTWADAREREVRRRAGVMVHVGPAPLVCVVPERHPARQARRTVAVFVSGPCAWCGDQFVIVDQLQARYCSRRCLARSAKSANRFKVSKRMRLAIYARDNWTCQLCSEPVDPDLGPSDPWAATLDHIECQSWALIPDHSPANLRLAHRWCNSVRGDETYYSVDILTA